MLSTSPVDKHLRGGKQTKASFNYAPETLNPTHSTLYNQPETLDPKPWRQADQGIIQP